MEPRRNAHRQVNPRNRFASEILRCKNHQIRAAPSELKHYSEMRTYEVKNPTGKLYAQEIVGFLKDGTPAFQNLSPRSSSLTWCVKCGLTASGCLALLEDAAHVRAGGCLTSLSKVDEAPWSGLWEL